MNPTPDPEDLLVIEQLLADTEPEDAEDLRPLLEDLRSFAHAGPVEPSPAVAALLLSGPGAAEPAAAPTEALTAVHSVAEAGQAKTISLDAVRASRAADQGARRSAGRPARPGRRRSLAVALALTGAIGAGTAAAAAADEGFRSSLNEGVSTVLGVLTGHVPAPAQRTPRPRPCPRSSLRRRRTSSSPRSRATRRRPPRHDPAGPRTGGPRAHLLAEGPPAAEPRRSVPAGAASAAAHEPPQPLNPLTPLH
ncbi:hypothetical protein [Sinomonas sp. P47F7]|uniref:hypothetical protein n=1 Tax=Sinomonas sp. P47F7 TaxID=3410987 RepID=UPI003BF4A037